MFFLFGVPYERGFFCNDESLMHPFHESTVTHNVLYIVGFGIPLISVRKFSLSSQSCEKKYFLDCANRIHQMEVEHGK